MRILKWIYRHIKMDKIKNKNMYWKQNLKDTFNMTINKWFNYMI